MTRLTACTERIHVVHAGTFREAVARLTDLAQRTAGELFPLRAAPVVLTVARRDKYPACLQDTLPWAGALSREEWVGEVEYRLSWVTSLPAPRAKSTFRALAESGGFTSLTPTAAG